MPSQSWWNWLRSQRRLMSPCCVANSRILPCATRAVTQCNEQVLATSVQVVEQRAAARNVKFHWNVSENCVSRAVGSRHLCSRVASELQLNFIELQCAGTQRIATYGVDFPALPPRRQQAELMTRWLIDRRRGFHRLRVLLS